MRNRNWLTSDWQQRHKSDDLITRWQLRTALFYAMWLCVMTLLLLVVALSGCTTLPQPPCLPAALPSAPALSEPPPSVSYSEQWRQLVERSLKKLTDTQMTPRP